VTTSHTLTQPLYFPQTSKPENVILFTSVSSGLLLLQLKPQTKMLSTCSYELSLLILYINKFTNLALYCRNEWQKNMRQRDSISRSTTLHRREVHAVHPQIQYAV